MDGAGVYQAQRRGRGRRGIGGGAPGAVRLHARAWWTTEGWKRGRVFKGRPEEVWEAEESRGVVRGDSAGGEPAYELHHGGGVAEASGDGGREVNDRNRQRDGETERRRDQPSPRPSPKGRERLGRLELVIDAFEKRSPDAVQIAEKRAATGAKPL